MSYSGAQHYVKISSAAKATTTNKTTSSSSSKTVTKVESGAYKFTKTTAIKGSTSDSAKTLGNYYKGDTVYYNAKITKNGQTWLRYLSYSGTQHYVKISGAAATTTSTNKSTSTSARRSLKVARTSLRRPRPSSHPQVTAQARSARITKAIRSTTTPK
nr:MULTISPECIES: SH3 domain-containing protein [Lactiplantibacillus]